MNSVPASHTRYNAQEKQTKLKDHDQPSPHQDEQGYLSTP